MHRACCRFMPRSGITETLSGVESVRVVHQVFALITIPFLAFYMLGLFRIAKCWKSFKYSVAKFWGMSIIGILTVFAAAQILQRLLEKVLL